VDDDVTYTMFDCTPTFLKFDKQINERSFGDQLEETMILVSIQRNFSVLPYRFYSEPAATKLETANDG
jgi:hypothetical protein